MDNMYDVVKNVIASRNYDLKNILGKIETVWVQSRITDEQKAELIALAQENAKVENSINILNKLEELDKRVRVLEDMLNKSEEGETEGDAEEVVTYPEYEVGHFYYNGDKITDNGKNYKCIAPEGVPCVWSPAEYPPYWEIIIADSEATEDDVTETETTE